MFLLSWSVCSGGETDTKRRRMSRGEGGGMEDCSNCSVPVISWHSFVLNTCVFNKFFTLISVISLVINLEPLLCQALG